MSATKRAKVFNQKNKKILWYSMAVLAIALPALVLLAQVTKQSVDTPYEDQWELIPLIQNIDNGTFSPISVWHLHNQHRLVFPKTIMLIMAYVTHWNVRAEMIISWLLAAAGFLVLMVLMRRVKLFKDRKWVGFAIALATSITVFSFNQYENWLWGWQLQWYLCNLGFLLAVLFLTKDRKQTAWTMLAAIGSAVLATYSLGSGQFVWIIGILILWVLKRPLKVWLAASVLVLGSYYISYHPVGYQTPKSYLIDHPLSVVKYFFSYLGRPMTESAHLVHYIGLVGFLVMGVVVALYTTGTKRKDLSLKVSKVVIPLSFIIYALFSDAATTLSRSGLGSLQALSSRYITISGLFWIGLVWLITITIYEKRKLFANTDVVACAFLCFVIAIALTVSIASDKSFTETTLVRRNVRNCIVMAKPDNTCLKSTYPSAQVVRPRVNYLKQKHWAGF